MEDMNHTDRSRRLQIAMDPSTSLGALLELAMEFPEAVAANPALPVALAADPAVVGSAHVVAIACGGLTSQRVQRRRSNYSSPQVFHTPGLNYQVTLHRLASLRGPIMTCETKGISISVRQ